MGHEMALKMAKRIADVSTRTGRRFRGLIVDDEPWVGNVLNDFLSLAQSVDTELCYNGLEAVQKCETERFDFVTVDLVMPELSGVETVKRIKEIHPQTPIMIVTGNATERLKTDAGVAGAERILEKPVTAEDFLQEIAELLEKNEERAV